MDINECWSQLLDDKRFVDHYRNNAAFHMAATGSVDLADFIDHMLTCQDELIKEMIDLKRKTPIGAILDGKTLKVVETPSP